MRSDLIMKKYGHSYNRERKPFWGLKQYLTMIWSKVGAITAITDFQTSFGSALSENLSTNKDRFITRQGSSETTDYYFSPHKN